MPVGTSATRGLEDFRRALEELDRQLLSLYARRRRLVSALWEYKRDRGLPLRDRAQEWRVLERARSAAVPERLPPAEAEALMRWVLLACRRAARSPSRPCEGAGVGPFPQRPSSRRARPPRGRPFSWVEGSYASPASEDHAGGGEGRKVLSAPSRTDP
jgi:chorismate mutase